jgi:haloalkane dehalogenase
MILEENRFVEWLLPKRIMRRLTDSEMDTYRRPFREPGEARRPTLTWPRQFPIEGEPASVVEIVRSNAAWLASSLVPKLFVNAEPGTISEEERTLCRSWPQTTEVSVRGLHFLQEDSPDAIGEALRRWYRMNWK